MVSAPNHSTHDETHEQFIALIRDESETWDYDRESSMTAQTEHLKGCQWPEFYDFIELVGQLLSEGRRSSLWGYRAL